ncbi:MAG: hypothetical protein J6Q53_03805 [Oscillospiraceae bacterium]|nr:hypothetical protein [Oscillospiraceae bacterium]
MINIFIQKNEAKVVNAEPLISGTANAVCVKFNFSEHWDGLLKTAVFSNGIKTISILDTKWQAGNVCSIPHEVLEEPGRIVRIGLRGTQLKSLSLAIPMFSIGKVQAGTDPTEDSSTDPTLPVWEQLREDCNKRSYGCSTWLEKYTIPDQVSTMIRVHFANPECIPQNAQLHLYRCIRNRGARTHWTHPADWGCEPEPGQHRWGYGLLLRNAGYPPIPEWMPNNGFLQTEFTISDEDRERGYIELPLATYLLPLLKPVDDELKWKKLGFVGLQGEGRENCHLLRFRICKDGKPIDVLGDTLRIGFRNTFEDRTYFVNDHLVTTSLYTSIR